jgi:predicted nucleotidyltransferase
MNDLGLNPDISDRYKLFLNDVMEDHQDKIHSVYIIGSALTQDYDPKFSDINSVFVLHEMDLDFLDLLAPLGKKYGKKRIAAPLIMTPRYIDESIDVFPIEFLNLKLLHYTVCGHDVFRDLEIPKSYLRRQCERELKAKLIGLRQGYISAAGEQRILTQRLVESYAGCMPLFKAVIVLLGREAPQINREILSVLEEVSGIKTAAFLQVLMYKRRKTKPTFDKLNLVFKDYYRIIEQLGDMVNVLED